MRAVQRWCAGGGGRRRRNACALLAAACVALALLAAEWAALPLCAAWRWRLPAAGPNATRLLLVADPQLVGYQHESRVLGWLTRFDSDRYMQRAYSVAFDAFKPDIVIFLGDLIDEAVFATDQEFADTVKRFRQVFPTSENTTVVYVPGDNDIGGEMEPVYEAKRERFERHFPPRWARAPPPPAINLHAVESLTDGRVHALRWAGERAFNLLLSHVPLAGGPALGQQLRPLTPHLVLSAHDHVAVFHLHQRRVDTRAGLRFRWPHNATDAPLLEVQVPTISYRMGVPDMAIGALSLARTAQDDFDMHYENLWLPKRFPVLCVYGLVLGTLATFLVGRMIACVTGKRTLPRYARVDKLEV